MHERIRVHPVCFPLTTIGDLADNWRKVGAKRVGLISTYAENEGLAAVQAAVKSGGYKVEDVNHIVFPFGTHLQRNDEMWRAPREKLNRVIDESKALGSNSIYIMTGGHGALTWEEAAECFRDGIAPCVKKANEAGVHILVECASPLYADIHLAHNFRDAITLAEIAGIGVVMDFFACWAEAGLRESIKRAMPRLQLVQVCDYIYGDRSQPCRAVPGDGAIPVKRLMGWVLEAGYTGAFDIELPGPRIQQEGPVAAVRRSADKVSEILQSLGA